MHRQQVLVDHGHHVVLVSENAVVDVQLGELGLVDAHGVLVLRHDQPLLDFMPAYGVELVIRDLEGDVVKGLDVPKLEEMVEGGEGSGRPEDQGEEKTYPSWQREAGNALILDNVAEEGLVSGLVVGALRVCVVEQHVVVHTFEQEQGEENDESKLKQFESFLKRKSNPLKIGYCLFQIFSRHSIIMTVA